MKRSEIDRLSVDWVTRVTGEPRFEGIVASLLEREVTQSELNQRIASVLGIIGQKEVETARMNLIGGLRWRGYEIPKTPRGQKSYQIVGWTKPRDQNYEEDGRDQAVAEEVKKLDPFVGSSDEINELIEKLRSRSPDHLTFENSLGYVLTYGLGRYDIFWSSIRTSLIFRRFPHHPRYLVMALTDGIQDHVEVGERLLGTRDVTVFNLSSKWRKVYNEYPERLVWKSRKQVIYDLRSICLHPEKFLSSSQRLLFRKLDRELHWSRVNGDECRLVLDRWAAVNKKKHPQIALGRDESAVKSWWPSKIPPFGGFSDGHPVCFSVYDLLLNQTSYAIHLVEKSLNYRVDEMPGGRSGMSDYNMIRSVRELYDRGIDYVNGGQYQSIGRGLASFKQRWASDSYRAYELVLSPNDDVE